MRVGCGLHDEPAVLGRAARPVGLRPPAQPQGARGVRLLALSLDEASVKIRTGPPDDGDSPDAALGLWAGELPLATTW